MYAVARENVFSSCLSMKCNVDDFDVHMKSLGIVLDVVVHCMNRTEY